MTEYVWVRDLGSGHAGPLQASEAAALGDAVKVDPKHPTHDAGGELLRWITQTTVAEAAGSKSGRSAATDKEK